MADRPIPFSPPMVRALLACAKTQTRRYADRQPGPPDNVIMPLKWWTRFAVGDRLWVREAYFQRGRWQTNGYITQSGQLKWEFVPADDVVLFEAPAGVEVRSGRRRTDPGTVAWHKRLGRFMPRRYSRLTLIATDVRVQRLQDISEADAIAEGVERSAAVAGDWCVYAETPRPFNGAAPTVLSHGRGVVTHDPRHAYATLWDHINGPGSWAQNPWVVAISFEVYRCNIDAMEAAHG